MKNTIIASLVYFGYALYFAASKPINYRFLKNSDGTATKTNRASKIDPDKLDAVGIRLFFIANNEMKLTKI